MKNLFLLFLPFLFLFGSCAQAPLASQKSLGVLNPNLHWSQSSLFQLETMILAEGKGSSSYDAKHPPVAIFDWDNTTVKNDVGDATFFWMVNHDLLRHPGDWKQSNSDLTEPAVSDLNKLCPGKKGSHLLTTKNTACADLLVSIYDEGKTADGKTQAWTHSHPDTSEPAYLWTVQLMAGYTPKEVHAFAKQAIDFNLSNPVGAKQKVGSKEYTAYLRIYDEQKDLIHALQEKGYDVWVATASAQQVVETISPQVGIDPTHVIGIRSVLRKGKLTDRFKGCGPFAKGNTEIITYRQGKRCFINQVIFKIKDAKAQMETRSPVSFAAGDSDTDVFFVKDAKYHLVIDRHKPELMCNALQNLDKNWIINPMFIEPKSKMTSDYSCSSFEISNQKPL